MVHLRFWGMLASGLALLCSAGCKDPERQAREELAHVVVLREAGGLDEAEMRLQQLLETFPETPAAADARLELDSIAHQRGVLRADLERVLEVVRGLMNRHQALARQYPRSLEDLDRRGPFVDADLVAGVVPDGISVFLLPGAGKGELELWAFHDRFGTGLHSRHGEAVPRELGAAARPRLRELFRVVDEGRGLVFLESAEPGGNPSSGDLKGGAR